MLPGLLTVTPTCACPPGSTATRSLSRRITGSVTPQHKSAAPHAGLPGRAVCRARPTGRFPLPSARLTRQTEPVIGEVDSALRSLIEREAVGRGDVEVVFDAPTREWAGRRNSPTIDVYLYDIREDLRRRERGLLNEYDERVRVIARHLPPRHFKLSYLVTAWTQRPEDEHRLLSA